MTIYVNGRFLCQPQSGVQRYARALLTAVDKKLSTGPNPLGDVAVIVPREVEAPNWNVLQLKIARGGRGHLWEQTTLLSATRTATLLSLGNSGPIFHPDQIVCFHDANLYEIPSAFSRSYRMWHRFLRPRLARRAAALVTVSEDSAFRLSAHLGIASDRFQIIGNAADHALDWPQDMDAITQLGLSRYLLCVGNRSPNKNVEALVRAHRRAGDLVSPLVIVGGQAPGLASINDGSGTIELGRVSDGMLRALYEEADAFIFPSLYEGFGIPPLEAMQLGVPVLCARAGAMPQLFGDAPIWFDPTSEPSMVATLEEFARLSRSERDGMVQRGCAVASRHSWDKSANALIDLLVKHRSVAASARLVVQPQQPFSA